MSALTMVAPASRPTQREAVGRPRLGDVVVAAEPDAPGRFTISQVPNTPSVTFESRSRALDVARAFAVSRDVDVWFRDGDLDERLLAYRRREGVS